MKLQFLGTKPVAYEHKGQPEKHFARSRALKTHHAFLVPLVSLGGFSPTYSNTLR
jgi:hypothetical protein